MHRRALKLTEKVLGKEHPGNLRRMNNWAGELGRQGEEREAGRGDRRAMRMTEKMLEREHPGKHGQPGIGAGEPGQVQGGRELGRGDTPASSKAEGDGDGKEHPFTSANVSNFG